MRKCARTDLCGGGISDGCPYRDNNVAVEIASDNNR